MKWNMRYINTEVFKNKSKIIVFVLAALLFLILCYSKCVKTEAFGGNLDASKPTFVLFYTNWCGHCKKIKPEFEKLATAHIDNVSIAMIDCEDASNKSLVEKQKISGYPTIRYYEAGGMNNSFKEYTGSRTYDAFMEYLRQ
jgi:thiol-disulfide isomerase/thioredoxin